MKTRYSKTWTLLGSLVGVAALGLASAALVLAEPIKPAPHSACAPLDDSPLDEPVDDGALEREPEPIGPVVLQPDPEPEPTPEPEPDTVDPDAVVVLKPGETAATIDSHGRFTGSASHGEPGEGLEKFEVIVAGRTLDACGDPIPGARLDVIVDTFGGLKRVLSSESSRVRNLSIKCCKPPRGGWDDSILPTAAGFSDMHGDYRIRITYYAAPGTADGVSVHAYHVGYLAGVVTKSGLSSATGASVDVTLPKAASIIGRCVDDRGIPAAGVTVYAYGEMISSQAVTDEEGRFSLTDLPGGDVTVSCYSENFLLRDDGSTIIPVRAGEANELSHDLRLLTRTSVNFELILQGDDEAESISGMLEFCDDEGTVLYTTWFNSTREDGVHKVKALMDNLPSGNWTMRLNVSGYKFWRGETRVSTTANMANEVGRVFLDETDEPANSRIKCSKSWSRG